LTAPFRISKEKSLFDRLQADVAGFRLLSQELKERTGINLPENSKNLSLMASRLHSRIADMGLETYEEYLELLRDDDPELIRDFIQALTTNTTHFFRESRHFDFLQEALPGMLRLKKPGSDLRVWCAAASTGQEPYTIGMTLLETLGVQSGWDLRFLATDIDDSVLRVAIEAVYTEKELGDLNPMLRQKYFESIGRGSGREFRVKPPLRNLIRYANLNLMNEYPFQHKFDIIFCRNVLIYFDRQTVDRVIEKLADALAPGGLLFIGHSETGALRCASLEPVSTAVYRKKGV
jgi:chemotaxis protein methyltransferase CheR